MSRTLPPSGPPSVPPTLPPPLPPITPAVVTQRGARRLPRLPLLLLCAAYLVPGLVLLLYLQRIGQKERQMAAKYPEFAAYQQRSVRLLPGLW